MAEKEKNPSLFAIICDHLSELTGGKTSQDISFLNLISRRSDDEKSQVRKGVVQLCESVILFMKKQRKDSDANISKLFNTIDERCSDPIMLIRRQCLDSIFEITQQNLDDSSVWTFWFNSVLPMISDREVTIQDIVVEHFNQLVIKNIQTKKFAFFFFFFVFFCFFFFCCFFFLFFPVNVLVSFY